jgi:hypothetical protein
LRLTDSGGNDVAKRKVTRGTGKKVYVVVRVYWRWVDSRSPHLELRGAGSYQRR